MRTVVGLLRNVPLTGYAALLRPRGMISDRVRNFVEKVIGSPGAIQGVDVAIDWFVKALIKHGSADHYAIFTQPLMVAPIAKELGGAPADRLGPGRVTVCDYSRLISKFSEYEFTNWLDLSLNFSAPSFLRSTHGKELFPISVIHHSISYPWLLHEYFLSILLAQSFPFDSVVCTTPSAETALAKLFQYVGEEFAREYGREVAFHGQFRTIPLGIDTDLFRPREKGSVRKTLHLPQDAFIVLYLGRISPFDKADLMPLIRVFADLVRDNPDRKLLLVLAGTQIGHCAEPLEHCALESGVKNHLRFIMRPRDAALLYSAADIFVSPIDNVQESFGLSAVEAMACGLPQVVSDWNGYRHTVVHGETGFLVPTYWVKCDADLAETAPLFGRDASRDHVSLAQSVAVDLGKLREFIQRLIDSHDLRMRMSERSRQRAMEEFSWPKVIRSHESLWCEMAQQARATKPIRGPHPTYLRPIYCEAFRHYPTYFLNDAARLSLTDAGERALRTGELLSPYHAAFKLGLLDSRLLADILCAVARHVLVVDSEIQHNPNGESRRAVSIAEITRGLALLSSDEHAHPDRFRRHMMWLLKFGFLQISDAAALDTWGYTPRATG